MNQRLEFYRELLTLDPASKVFYPLAQLLAEDGQDEEAVGILQAGLAIHPDHLRAKLLLVECLASTGNTEQAQQEAVSVGSMLSSYPQFFSLWAQKLPGCSDGQALALEMLAANLEGEEVSLTKVMRAGLAALSGNSTDDEPEPEVKIVTNEPREAEVRPAQEQAAPEAQAVMDDHMDDGEEEPTLRTRTMAELLIQQGDVEEAAGIYQDLLEKAQADGDEHKAQGLAAKLAELRGEPVPVMGAEVPEEAPEVPSGQNQRVVNLLSRLAERLENRAANDQSV